jgi:hypothetical protein
MQKDDDNSRVVSKASKSSSSFCNDSSDYSADELGELSLELDSSSKLSRSRQAEESFPSASIEKISECLLRDGDGIEEGKASVNPRQRLLNALILDETCASLLEKISLKEVNKDLPSSIPSLLHNQYSETFSIEADGENSSTRPNLDLDEEESSNSLATNSLCSFANFPLSSKAHSAEQSLPLPEPPPLDEEDKENFDALVREIAKDDVVGDEVNQTH